MSNPIFIFGDSLGKGVVFDSIQNKYKFLKDNFVRLFSQKSGIIVENYSMFGCTVTKGMKIVERHLGELGDGDVVLLEFGGNDCDFNWAQISARPNDEHLPKTPINEFKSTYNEMIKRLKEAGKQPVLLTLPPIDPIKYFSRISQGLSSENILRWLGDKGRIYRWHEYYSLTVCKISELAHTPVIDLRSAFLTRKDCFDLLCDDGIHPNEKGHALISEVISGSVSDLSFA